METTTLPVGRLSGGERRAGLPPRSAKAVGFTLIEVVLVISLVGILSAVTMPLYSTVVHRARITRDTASLVALAESMRRFHNDTGAWPHLGGTWQATATATTLGPAQFTTADTAMVGGASGGPVEADGTTPFPPCQLVPPGSPCFAGPYVNAAAPWPNSWGHPLMYAYIPPGATQGGRLSPAGAIVIWSTGQDGIDQTSTNGSCDLVSRALGACSDPGSDDIVLFVSTAT
jgi:prepilin-type N-terminal cleavage/methylation domain-containing protein